MVQQDISEEDHCLPAAQEGGQGTWSIFRYFRVLDQLHRHATGSTLFHRHRKSGGGGHPVRSANCHIPSLDQIQPRSPYSQPYIQRPFHPQADYAL